VRVGRRPVRPWRVWRARARGRLLIGDGARLGRPAQLDLADGASLTLAPGAVVEPGLRVSVGPGARVDIGPGAIVAEGCRLVAHAGIEVGEAARLDAEVSIVDLAQEHGDPEVPVRLQGARAAPVRIGPGAHLGRAAGVEAGVTVGRGADVAPHSVVDRDVPAGARVLGVPAREAPEARPG
jgi:acetyltransferase-like isoleucine patch superfamily enzyme